MKALPLRLVRGRIADLASAQRRRHALQRCRALNFHNGRPCGTLGPYSPEHRAHICALHRKLHNRGKKLSLVPGLE